MNMVTPVSPRRGWIRSQPEPGRFRAIAGDHHGDFVELAAAKAFAEDHARKQASAAAIAAGAAEVELTVQFDEKTAMAEGREIFIEGMVTARASGRPRIG